MIEVIAVQVPNVRALSSVTGLRSEGEVRSVEAGTPSGTEEDFLEEDCVGLRTVPL
jgi:hypothetical protein